MSFAELFADAIRLGRPMSLLMIDVDKFKAVNDRHGHPAGDKALKSISRLVSNSALRRTWSPDTAARNWQSCSPGRLGPRPRRSPRTSAR